MGIFNKLKSALGYGVKKTTEDVADSVRVLIGAAKDTLESAKAGYETVQQAVQKTAVLGQVARTVLGNKEEDKLLHPEKYVRRPGAILTQAQAEQGTNLAMGTIGESGAIKNALGEVASHVAPLLSEARKYKTLDDFESAIYGGKYNDAQLKKLGFDVIATGRIRSPGGAELSDIYREANIGISKGTIPGISGKLELDPLLQEARKYKTAEEFVKAQELKSMSEINVLKDYEQKGAGLRGIDINEPQFVKRTATPKQIMDKLSPNEQEIVWGKLNQPAVDTTKSVPILHALSPTSSEIVVGDGAHALAKAINEGMAKPITYYEQVPKSQLTSLWEQAQGSIPKGATAKAIAPQWTEAEAIKHLNNNGIYQYGDIKAITKAMNEGLSTDEALKLGEQAQKGASAGKVAQEARTAEQATTELAQQLPGQVPESIAQQTVPQVGGGGSLPPSIPPGGKKSIGDLMKDAVDRLSVAIRESAKPARGVLEEQYAAERAKRTAKLASIQERGGSLPQQLGALKGPLVSPENKMFGKINLIEEDIKTLFNAANFNPQLDVYEKLNTQTALSKLLQGIIPTNSELALLQKTYGDNLVKIILDKRSTGQKILSGLGELANLPRSIMSSVDLSAPFRQGLALISHPKAFGKAFLSMFSQFGSETAFKAVQDGIVQMPEYGLMKQAKLALTDVGTMLTGREERFMSNWAEKIPVAGKLIRASGRAYVGFLNKLRADVFTDIVRGVRASGRKLDAPLIEAIGDFVNTASGRGSKLFGHVPVGNAMPILNGLFFSPRLMASRTTLLNPVKYVTADPVVRKEMLKSLFSVLGAGLTMMGLAKMAGARVGDNPTSSDFGKIIFGNTRVDPWGGFQQYVRMAAQLWTGKYTSTTTGKQFTLGEGYKPITRFDILWRQIESKEAPIASFITDLLRQQDYKGDPVSVPKEIIDRFKPMMVSDLYDVYKDNPALLPLGILSAFGVGIQTYEPKPGTFKSKLKTPIQTKEYKPKVKPFKSKLK